MQDKQFQYLHGSDLKSRLFHPHPLSDAKVMYTVKGFRDHVFYHQK